MNRYVAALGAVLATGVLAVPGAAVAKPPSDTWPEFLALSEVDGGGRMVTLPIRPGETATVNFGVRVRTTAPVLGMLVRLHLPGDLRLPRTFDNCVYFADGDGDGAWCRFDGKLTAGETYALDGLEVAALPRARADRVTSVVAQWRTLGLDDIEDLALADSATSRPVRGDGSTLHLDLEETTTLASAGTSTDGFAYLRLAGASPSSSPADPELEVVPAGSTAPAGGATEAAEPPAAGSAGGLPITGPKTAAFAGAGALLALLGLLGFRAVRRRTRFVA